MHTDPTQISSICVQSLTDYASGKLTFKWFSLDEIDEAKEYASHFDEAELADMEGPIASIQSYVGSHLMWDTIERVQDLIDTHGEPFLALLEIKNLNDINLDEIEEDFSYAAYENIEEYGYEIAGDQIPEHLDYWFDFTKYGEASLVNHAHAEFNHTLYVFY
jgi:hypothetical protein